MIQSQARPRYSTREWPEEDFNLKVAKHWGQYHWVEGCLSSYLPQILLYFYTNVEKAIAEGQQGSARNFISSCCGAQCSDYIFRLELRVLDFHQTLLHTETSFFLRHVKFSGLHYELACTRWTQKQRMRRKCSDCISTRAVRLWLIVHSMLWLKTRCLYEASLCIATGICI